MTTAMTPVTALKLTEPLSGECAAAVVRKFICPVHVPSGEMTDNDDIKKYAAKFIASGNTC